MRSIFKARLKLQEQQMHTMSIVMSLQHRQLEINTEHPNKKLMINTEVDKSKSTVKENIETNLQTNANR